MRKFFVCIIVVSLIFGTANLGFAQQKHKIPLLAGALSFLVPGAGQCYNGQYVKGGLFFLTCWLVVPYVWSIVDGVTVANKINKGEVSLLQLERPIASHYTGVELAKGLNE